ncbi:MAG: OmpA family protein [Bacteroidota bacterium]|nr:OmpA family protein [Bacteroidota bacterium]
MKKEILLICLAVFLYTRAYSQSLFQRIGDQIKEKTEEQVEERIENRSGEAVEKSMDKAEDAVKKSAKKNKKQASSTKTTQSATEDTQTINKETEEGNPTQSTQPKLESYSKYDFVPGDKILYYEDFSQDAIGDFPALWTTNGGGEVKTINIAPGHWFHMNKEDAVYCYTKKIAFPENFIMEFDVIPDGDFSNGYALTFYEDKGNAELTDDLYPGQKGLHVSFEEGRWYTKGYNNSLDIGGWLEGESSTNPVVVKQVNHVIIWVQNRRLRIYHKGAKVLDMPTNIHAGTKFNRIRFSGWSTHSTPYVTNLKITTAAPDTRSKLITEGKLVCYGIYFDVNKDEVKAESYGTLNDIAKVLKENPDVRIKIVGHTDSDGDNAKNLDLSKRRAASVKKALSGEFGISENRIQTDGKGESEPISPNTTTEGKSKNRRVEFIKI